MTHRVPPRPAPTPYDADAARLLVDAEAFLRLGLVDKAIAHLSSALGREPRLRGLREPLLKLYVARRKYPSAIAELRCLLESCRDPQDEIRYLRYLLRLGEQDAAAEARLARLLSQQPADPAHISAEFVHPDAAETSLEDELRDHLRTHRPPTDLTQTQAFSEDEAQRNLDRLLDLAAVTNPDGQKIEEVAEEMAYHNGTLKDELDAVDGLIRGKSYDAAATLLRSLRERYPHSKRVQAKLGELGALPGEKGIGLAISLALSEGSPSHAAAGPSHAAASPAPAAAAARAPQPERKSRRAARPRDIEAEPGSTTLEVDPNDIKDERPAKATRPAPPPPPSSFSGVGSEGGIPRALAMASTLRLAGKYEQALALYHQVSSDPTYGIRAVRMIGVCLRDLDRLDDAILTFTRAVNLPQASESELSELFYELGATYEQLGNPAEAILYYQLALGSRGSFRDAPTRIAHLQDALLTP